MPPTKQVRCSKWSLGAATRPVATSAIASDTKLMLAAPSEKSRTRYLLVFWWW
jgi:hypothetical protein